MMVQFKKVLVVFLGLLLSTALTGCQTIQYYSQAINGQHRILQSRQPISEITADPNSSKILRQRLNFIMEVRAFAEDELQLPVKNNYLTYVDLKRPYVAWNVVAAPEFSMEPKTWCYPFVGCAAYRGYFARADANQYADSLKKQGYDVHVGGVTAYSTLGWFDDPVLSSFIRRSKASSAALLFHELAHQVLYAPDDTTFNESFATFVEQEGLRRWQKASGNSAIYMEYLEGYRRQQQFVRLVFEHRQKLEILYQTDLTPLQKRTKKASIFADMRNEFKRLKTMQTGLAAYDAWMNQPLNNAKISGVVAYHDFVPAFGVILADKNGDLSQFYETCRKLAQKNKDERHRILSAAMQRVPVTAGTGYHAAQLDR
ncbi:MAG: aminopeptidase [Desulfobacteraceae bacterium]|jgi:predicted aminopeptidase|nr:aminopeptidase [Desulfobacteraceae bacterium]